MCTRVLVLLALLVGVAQCFKWDIVVGKAKRLEFYKNGNLTHTEEIPSVYHIVSITYDPVHYRLLFVDKSYLNIAIASFDLLTRKIQPLIKTKLNPSGYTGVRVAYDPVTDLLFFKQDKKIHSFALHQTCSSTEIDGNIFVTSAPSFRDISVDSCGGYIYWNTNHKIERGRFDGSEREVLIVSPHNLLRNLAIDQQTQEIYWIEKTGQQVSIESADLGSKNRTTLYIIKNDTRPSSLVVSKDFIYWRGSDPQVVWQLPKNPHQHVPAKVFDIIFNYDDIFQIVAANYRIEEQTQGHQDCESLKSLIPETPDECLFCVHGAKVSGESRCECAQGYTGERCDVAMCHNYCLQGDCSVSAEGQPKCRCNDGYSGERCEVNVCHNEEEPV